LSLGKNLLQIVTQGVALGYTYCGLSGHFGGFAKGLPHHQNHQILSPTEFCKHLVVIAIFALWQLYNFPAQ